MLILRLLFDVVHLGLMLLICMTLFKVKLNKDNKVLFVISTVSIFVLMSLKSYVQLETPFFGRMLELLLLLFLAWCVSKLIKKDFIVSLSLSFFVNSVSIPVYLLIAQFYSGITSHDAFRQAEFATSIALTVFYGGLLILLLRSETVNTLLKTVVLKLKWVLFSVALLMYDVIMITAVYDENPYFSIGFYAVMIPIMTLLIVSIVYFIYRKKEVN